jgi:predicted PurR-regulated permease PerM/methylmalonyl-CoA mutase cobalamin-binding subunit
VPPSDQFRKSAWMLASIAVVVAALYLAKGILVPLTLAMLLSFLLSPVCDWLERRRLGRIPAVLFTAFLGFSVLGAATWTAVVQMYDLTPKMHEYGENLEEKLSSTNAYVGAAWNQMMKAAQGFSQNLATSDQTEQPQGTEEWPYSVRVLTSPATPLEVLGGTFGTLLQAFGSTGIVIVLVVFFLVRRDDLRDRFIRLVGQGHVTLTTQMLEDAGTRVSRYLSMQFLINATFGTAVGIGLYLIGVPNAILWGIVAATLRFIPYIGPWIAAAMPIGLSLAISTGWAAPVFTIALFVVLELFSNNVMEPWLYGKHTGVSAVAVLLAAIFWTWLWGPLGLLLATPLTVCLLVIGKHVPQLSFLDILLGNEPVFEPKKRVYQRLLAGDQEEATDLLEGLLEQTPLVEVYDTVLIPALALAEAHWHLGEIDDGRHEFILESLMEMIQDRGEGQQEEQATEGFDDPPRVRILCLPARDEADAIAAAMLAQVLATSGCLVRSVSFTTTASELVDLVEQCQADVVCISATPPAAAMHARRLCKRLRGRFPEVHLVVGLWNAPSDLSKAKVRIGGGDATHVVSTLAEAQEQVRLLIQPLLPSPEMKAEPENRPAIMEEAVL